jgi:probable rRNA maturation factor
VQYNFIDLDNKTDKQIDLDLLREISAAVTEKDIELVICDNEYIHNINLEFRQKNKATDVLSFPYEQMPNTTVNIPLGSIVISVDFVQEKADEYNHSFDDELALLFIHGILHLLGFDHEKDDGEHREKEEELIKKFKLPKSLIVRTSEE